MTNEKTLKIENLHISVEDKEIVKGITLTIRPNEVHTLMGPNGSGKSSLAYAIMGHPKYKITKGDVKVDGVSVIDLLANERAKAGLFLAFQYPVTVSGVNISTFLREALNGVKSDGTPESRISPMEFKDILEEKMSLLDIDQEFVNRYLNEGFSGGEKKRCEILQMAILEPSFAVLDETDSGLDIDALKIVSHGVNQLMGPNLGVLLITHYQRILRYIKPNHVHIMLDGKIELSGGPELVEKLEDKGYQWIRDLKK